MKSKLTNPDGTKDVGFLVAETAVRPQKLWSHSWHKADARFFPADRR